MVSECIGSSNSKIVGDAPTPINSDAIEDEQLAALNMQILEQQANQEEVLAYIRGKGSGKVNYNNNKTYEKIQKAYKKQYNKQYKNL